MRTHPSASLYTLGSAPLRARFVPMKRALQRPLLLYSASSAPSARPRRAARDASARVASRPNSAASWAAAKPSAWLTALLQPATRAWQRLLVPPRARSCSRVKSRTARWCSRSVASLRCTSTRPLQPGRWRSGSRCSPLCSAYAAPGSRRRWPNTGLQRRIWAALRCNHAARRAQRREQSRVRSLPAQQARLVATAVRAAHPTLLTCLRRLRVLQQSVARGAAGAPASGRIVLAANNT